MWAGGHVHPGGLRDDLSAVRCNGQDLPSPQLLFRSDAVLTPNRGVLGSWDFRMTVTPPDADWHYHVKAGDRITVTGVYDTSHPWYEAMAIMVAWAHPLAPGETAKAALCQLPSTTAGSVTGAPQDNPYFGNTDPTWWRPDPNVTPASGGPVTSVAIAGFNYQPGGNGEAPAAVTAGSTVTFTNVDAAASIFHTVTSCEPTACTGDYGQAYPLPKWLFDSSQPATGWDQYATGELGFGPPLLTAAAQRASWSWQVPSTASIGTTYTFFCRIHPQMRGSLKVVSQ